MANQGDFRMLDASQVLAIGHMRSLDQIKIQCFKSANHLCMDLVYEMMIAERAPNYVD